jgi:hypothetical protein
MPGTRYEYRLWRKHGKTGFLARFAEDRQVTSTNTGWFDLDDKAATVEEIARLVARFGDQKTGIEGYWLELLDPVTQQRKIIEPSGHDLADAMQNGNASAGVPQSRVSLADVTNKELVRELDRRLQGR